MSRIVLLTEGFSNPRNGKTAASILRYRRDEVVGVVDSHCAGRRAGELFGVGDDVPVRADLESFDADELLIGVAPTGLLFPPAWRRLILRAIERGWNVVNGTHTFVTEDPEIVRAARKAGVRLWDVREPDPSVGCSADKARDCPALRVHTVGTDCAIGKMTVAIELDRELRRRGVDSEFLATGQTGIMIAGKGLPIDRMVSDFVAGGAEKLVLDSASREVVLIEGQGSLFHPLYSGVTLGLLHGSAPDALVMCTMPTRAKRVGTEQPIPPLREALDVFDRMANVMHPCRTIGVAVNTYGLDDATARAEVDRAEAESGLPATDVLRFGTENLVEAILSFRRPLRKA